MSDLKELYQEMILHHNKSPQNFRAITNANHQARGYNPLCGDQLNLYVQVDGDKITDVAFQGSGCAISKASASMMTAAIKGKTLAEAENIFELFHHMVTDAAGKTVPEALGKLAVFSGVAEFPTRVKCASLAWHTLKSALANTHQVACTEGDTL